MQKREQKNTNITWTIIVTGQKPVKQRISNQKMTIKSKILQSVTIFKPQKIRQKKQEKKQNIDGKQNMDERKRIKEEKQKRRS